MRLADTRKMTIDDAKILFEDLARATIRNWRRQAVADDRIAAIKSKLAADSADDTAQIAAAACELRNFILANRDQFQKPRKVKTQFGTFGLEIEKELEIADEDVLMQILLEHGYDDCWKTTRSLLKKPIADRIAAGETFPGCRILEGDVAKYKVDRALLDEVAVVAEKETAAAQ